MLSLATEMTEFSGVSPPGSGIGLNKEPVITVKNRDFATRVVVG